MLKLPNTLFQAGSAPGDKSEVRGSQESPHRTRSYDNSTPSDKTSTEPEQQAEQSQNVGFLSNVAAAGQNMVSGATKNVGSGVTATADLAQGGATLVKDATDAGFDISQKVAKSGLDATTSTANLAGTAIGGIVDAAAASSGQVFEPVASAVKALEGFDKLGEASDQINGLTVGAVKQVGSWAMKALNMSGITPTLFDPNADGVVHFEDTVRGLIILGLDEKNAKYAAYALHLVFSYPTGVTWVPKDTSLPIHIQNLGRTRWGQNWGGYDRMDWVEDVDINTFFNQPEEGGETWQQKFRKGRQYFGVLLLIFEWGTTWPFWLPDFPAQELPFKDEIGTVVRKLIVPTIFANFQRAREGHIKAGNKPPAKQEPENA